MAFLGSVGKFFSENPIGILALPISAPIIAAKAVIKGPQVAIAPVVGAGVGTIRSVIAGIATGSRNPRIDNTGRSLDVQQFNAARQPDPGQYFQPVQFSGGSYDPYLGGGYPTWPGGTPWTGLETQRADWEETDWAAGW